MMANVSDLKPSEQISDNAIPSLIMRLDEIVKRACEEPTLLDALSYTSAYDTERAINQARRNDFKSWDTFSKFLFKRVIEEYSKRGTLVFKEKENIIDTLTGVQYCVVNTPRNVKDLITEEPGYQISRSSTNSVDNTLFTVSQLVMESGRFKRTLVS